MATYRLEIVLLTLLLAPSVASQGEGTESAPPGNTTRGNDEQTSLMGPEVGHPESHTRVREGLRSFATPMVGVRPERVAPGGAGAIHVVLALQQSVVLKVGTHFDVAYERRQGPVTLGEWRRDEPKIGELPTRFKGHIVFDNTTTFVVPFTVDAGAQHDQFPIRFTIEADVNEADTARYRGRFRMEVSGAVGVGPPIPTPVPVAVASVHDSLPNGPANQSIPAGAPQGVGEAPPAGVDARVPSEAPIVDDRPDAATERASRGEPDGGGSWPWIAAVIAFLSLLGLVVLRRPRAG